MTSPSQNHNETRPTLRGENKIKKSPLVFGPEGTNLFMFMDGTESSAAGACWETPPH